MNIFGVGGAELVVILAIMLIVAGPKRMIRWAYVMGQWVGKLRVLWAQTVDALQQELDAAGVEVQLPKEPPTRQSLNRFVQDTARSVARPLEDAAREVEAEAEVKKRPANGHKQAASPAPSAHLGTWSGQRGITTDETQQQDENRPHLGTWSAPEQQDGE